MADAVTDIDKSFKAYVSVNIHEAHSDIPIGYVTFENLLKLKNSIYVDDFTIQHINDFDRIGKFLEISESNEFVYNFPKKTSSIYNNYEKEYRSQKINVILNNIDEL